MRRLIAHAGMHKTGTTAFQSWLQQERANLLDEGYFVPDQGSGAGNHAGLVKAIYNKRNDSEVLRRFSAAERSYLEHDILLSAEHIGIMEPAELSVLTEYFRRLAPIITSILVVRDPVAGLNSRFAQKRKAMKWQGGGFAGYLRDALSEKPDHRFRIERLQSAGFEMRVLPYDATFTSKGSPRSIMELDVFGVLAQRFDWSQITRKNESMGAIALIVMDLLFDLILIKNPTHERRSPHELRARVIGLVGERFTDLSFNGFTAETRAQVIERYAESNAWVADHFFAASWDETLPPQPVRAVSPETIDELCPADAAAVREIVDTVLREAEAENWFDPDYFAIKRKRERQRARVLVRSATPAFSHSD